VRSPAHLPGGVIVCLRRGCPVYAVLQEKGGVAVASSSATSQRRSLHAPTSDAPAAAGAHDHADAVRLGRPEYAERRFRHIAQLSASPAVPTCPRNVTSGPTPFSLDGGLSG
jgi:hypothetical protein